MEKKHTPFDMNDFKYTILVTVGDGGGGGVCVLGRLSSGVCIIITAVYNLMIIIIIYGVWCIECGSRIYIFYFVLNSKEPNGDERRCSQTAF